MASSHRETGRSGRSALRTAVLALLLVPPSTGQDSDPTGENGVDFAALEAPTAADRLQRRFDLDRRSLQRFYGAEFSPTARDRLDRFCAQWVTALDQLLATTDDEPAELARLREQIRDRRRALAGERAKDELIVPYVPFAADVFALLDDQRRTRQIEPREAAGLVDRLAQRVESAVRSLGDTAAAEPSVDTAVVAAAARRVSEVNETLTRWHRFYDRYDPLFTWWLRMPQERATAALKSYAAELEKLAGSNPGELECQQPAPPPLGSETTDVPDLRRLSAQSPSPVQRAISHYFERNRSRRRGRRTDPAADAAASDRRHAWLASLEAIDFDSLTVADRIDWVLLRDHIQDEIASAAAGRDEPAPPEVLDESGIPGRPIGTEALQRELTRARIDYEPAELIEIGHREMAWCRAELRRAAAEMGFGEDWQAAVEHVKQLHVEPGQQPRLIHELAWEAIDYLGERDLLSVPTIAAEAWGMQMMSPERQLVNPFFTGGPVISVSFPTDTMSHEAKLQSLRGNNIPFARATVHHELIPGHNLQLYMNSRYSTHRRPFASPFWLEGWALYWEMRLYEQGFPATPEDRVGFLVWRSHRCARIVFSLSFHAGTMLPQECVDYLVDNVRFERRNAEAEVRRSFGGSYTPLYQAAYMLGGLQIRQLQRELVASGKLSEREFHDTILQAGSMPIVMLRALLTETPIPPEGPGPWRFYGELR